MLQRMAQKHRFFAENSPFSRELQNGARRGVWVKVTFTGCRILNIGRDPGADAGARCIGECAALRVQLLRRM